MIHETISSPQGGTGSLPQGGTADAEALATIALDRIAQAGLPAIRPALADLRAAGLDPASDLMQPVLAEALFALLEALEADLADTAVYGLLFDLDPATARAGQDLLLFANFPDGPASHDAGFYTLSDSTALLLVALAIAAGETDRARHLLTRIDYGRNGPRLDMAVFLLRARLQTGIEPVVEQLIFTLLDGIDHPELWASMDFLLAQFPGLDAALARRHEGAVVMEASLAVLHAVSLAAAGHPDEALALLEPVAIDNSLSPLVQGALFHIRARRDPGNPANRLAGRFCTKPFQQMDVLENSTHLCCVSWLQASAGNLSTAGDWREVWNSEKAQKIRASVHDGSYRYCNKTACPAIAAGTLPTGAETAARSPALRDIIESSRTALDEAPAHVNLAYDISCNLSCPSCRTRTIAVNAATRTRFETLQEKKILPMLKQTNSVFISGNGDPFASKNFRSLIARLGPEDYPDLRFQLMTNGMLLTPAEWARLPALHRRVSTLRISLDAATGPTHELLRRGARWSVMEQNLAFARQLRAEGQVERLCLPFTVQIDNYREMGAAVDLGRHYGADSVTFMRLTNWGTFSKADYAHKAVFMPSHPEHGDFLREMQDPRLRDPIAALMDLSEFAGR